MQKSPMQSLEQPGSMHGLTIGIRLRCPRSLVCKRSQVLEPLRWRAAGAVLVLGSAAPAHPVLPPDPLQVVDLDGDQAHDGEEDLRLAHGASLPYPALRRKSRQAAASRPRPPAWSVRFKVSLVPGAPAAPTEAAGEDGDEPE